MSIDTKILEQRLITRDSVRGSASISRSAERLANFRSPIVNNVVVENFLREIAMFRAETEKSCRAYDSYKLQVVEYQKLQNSVSVKAGDAVRDIDQLKVRLEQENMIRSHRTVCEAQALKVNRHKNRSYLNRNIAQIEDNVAHTLKRLESINHEISTRKVQFDSLLTALLDLESQIIETCDVGDESEDDDVNMRGQRRETAECQNDVDQDTAIDESTAGDIIADESTITM